MAAGRIPTWEGSKPKRDFSCQFSFCRNGFAVVWYQATAHTMYSIDLQRKWLNLVRTSNEWEITQSSEDIQMLCILDSWSHFRFWTSLQQVLEKGPRFPMYMISSSKSKHIWNSVHLSMKEGRLLFVLFVCCVVSPKLHSASFAALLELLESPWWGGGGAPS